jgi:SAM-dependent methyltransferase
MTRPGNHPGDRPISREALDLGAAMRGLYETGAYYVSIEAPAEPAKGAAYEEDYWGEIVDPDGRRRNRLGERDGFLNDLKTELGFIHGLAPGRLLDIGCGPGWLLSGIDDSWEKHGIEVSAFAATHARRHGAIFEGPLLDCPFADGSFDLVVLHHVIEHLRDPVANLRVIHRILKGGGKLILGTPDFDSGVARRFGSNYRLLHDKTHISLFSNDSMHRFLRDHGFRILFVDYPFFETRHFTEENLLRLFDTERVSPPFHGNFMTFYCVKE